MIVAGEMVDRFSIWFERPDARTNVAGMVKGSRLRVEQ